MVRGSGQTQAAVAEQLWVDEPIQEVPPNAGVGFVQVRVCVLAVSPQAVGQETGLQALQPPLIGAGVTVTVTDLVSEPALLVHVSA